MAQGDSYMNCQNANLSVSQILRKLVYDDGNGNPVLKITLESTALQPFFSCSSNKDLSNSQVFRRLIIQDGSGKPKLNTF